MPSTIPPAKTELRFRLRTAAAALLLCAAAPGIAGPVSPDDLRRHVEALTADAMGGRLTGSDGARAAADYIAGRFAETGLTPEGDSFLQSFDFTAGVSIGEGNRLTIGGEEARLEDDWVPLGFSASDEVAPSAVIFAGYGILAAGGSDYDSFGDADVTGKWVMVWRGVPLDAPVELRTELARYADLRYKASVLKSRGARGMIAAPAPGVTYDPELPRLANDTALARAEIPALAVGQTLANRLLASLGADREALETRLKSGEPVAPILLPDIEIGAQIALNQRKAVGLNVLARIDLGAPEGTLPVMVGAHFDHLGRGEVPNSLARSDEAGQIHPGADDNASGVAALIEIAAALSDGCSGAARDIVLAAWSGEELGLIGSHAYAQTSDVAAYINLDMVGRFRDTLQIAGLASSPDWNALVEDANTDLPIERVDTPYVPSDATTFYTDGAPVLSLFTGVHTEYHSPRDTADTLNYDGLARIADLTARLTCATARAEPGIGYAAGVAAPPRPGGRRAGVTLGTIPQYAETGPGVAIADTVSGGPAQRAGVLGGDVITGLAGSPVSDIYDFMRILNGLKPGEAVAMTVTRDGRDHALEIVPVARADQ